MRTTESPLRSGAASADLLKMSFRMMREAAFIGQIQKNFVQNVARTGNE